MVDKIILCSDGTNNQGGLGRDTNVWRLYNLLEHNKTEGSRQHIHYDDGVGTEKSMPKKILGLAFGWGLSRNIRELYTYLASHYTAGSHVYLFGFSRGAYTIRQLANIIDYCGLPNWNANTQSPADLTRMVEFAESSYKQWCDENLGVMGFNQKFYSPTPGSRLCDSESNNQHQGISFSPVENVFVGVWDTVNSTGVPVDEMRSFLPAWVQNKTIEKMPQCVRGGFHAISIDDERKAFDPTLWNEAQLNEKQYIEQVWFAGMHSNVGGGYPKDGLAKVSLKWMVNRLQNLDAIFDDISKEDLLSFNEKVNDLKQEANVNSKMHDSRAGVGAYYRYFPRDITKITETIHKDSEVKPPQIHESVFDRIQHKTNFYAPTNFSSFKVANDDSLGIKEYQVSYRSLGADGKEEEISKEEILYNVNGRKRLYILFLISTFLVVAAPLVQDIFDRIGINTDFNGLTNQYFSLPGEQYFLSAINLLLNILPDFVSRWMTWYGHRPILLLVALFILFLLRSRKKAIESQQSDLNNDVWHNLNHDLLNAIVGNQTQPTSAPIKKRGVKGLGKLSKMLRR